MLVGAFVRLNIMLIFTIGKLLNSAGSSATKIVIGLSFIEDLSLVVFAGAELITGNNFVTVVRSLNKTVTWVDTYTTYSLLQWGI